MRLYSALALRSSAYSVAISNEDVYVVGTGFIEEIRSPVAILWKNGIDQRIDYEIGHQATSVIVVNDSVYIAGGSVNSCPVWKFDVD